jgi:hypothetical protein
MIRPSRPAYAVTDFRPKFVVRVAGLPLGVEKGRKLFVDSSVFCDVE